MLLNQFPPSSSLLKASKINLKHKRNRKKESNKTPNILPYPKPTPNPLIISPNSVPTTKHQAISRLLQDLQISISNGIPVDSSMYSSFLEALFTTTSSSLRHVTKLHSLIPPPLLHKSADLSSKLLRLYAIHGRLEQAHKLFDSMPQRNRSAFAWNSLISGYVKSACYEDAMALYYQMDEEAVNPDSFTYTRVLKACAGIGTVQLGEAVHRDVVKSGFWNDLYVLNALVDMYAKCGDIMKARRVFNSIVDRDHISLNSMIVGYIRHGLLNEALVIFRAMVRDGTEPDFVTLSSLLTSVSYKLGLEVHCWVLRRGYENNVSVANSLIGLYSGKKRLSKAVLIFEGMEERNIVSWNAIISAHRRELKVLELFGEMVRCGEVPDKVTFVCLLSACAKLRLVREGRMLFNVMVEKYGIGPEMVHYGCMVDMLGRAGLIEEAYEMIVSIDGAGGGIWGALLHACFVHANVEIGEAAGDVLLEMEPDNEHNVLLLLKMYEKAGRVDGIERVKKVMRERGFEMKGCV